MIRTDNKPLQQIIRRIEEKKNANNNIKTCDCDESTDLWVHKKQHYDGPLLSGLTNPQYLLLSNKKFTIIAKDIKNSCIMLTNEEVVMVNNIAFNNETSSYFIIGCAFLMKKDLYSKPCKSSLLSIYAVKNLSELNCWPLEMIKTKMYTYSIPYEDGWYAAIPLLHSDKAEYPFIQ